MMPRITLYIGIAEGVSPKAVLEDAQAKVRPSTAGGWEIQRGAYHAYALPIGTKTVGGVPYRVYSLLVDVGDQRKVYRWLRDHPDVVGPYTRHNAPNALKTLLGELSGTYDAEGNLVALGEPVTCSVLAGEERAAIDALDYVEGVKQNGDADEIVEVAT